MKKSDATEQVISRRKALGRIGLFATAAYTVPAFATLSMVHASSSGASSASDGASGATSSQSESNSAPSAQSDVSTPSDPSPSDVEETCGSPEDAGYLQCLKDNGWEDLV